MKTPRNAAYLKYIRNKACVACTGGRINDDSEYAEACNPSEAAHVRMGNGGGMALKPSDYRTVPLCHEHHAQQHQGGERSFWAERNLDPDKLILQLLVGFIQDKKASIAALEHAAEAERT